MSPLVTHVSGVLAHSQESLLLKFPLDFQQRDVVLSVLIKRDACR